MDKSLVIDTLNNILEVELGGVVRYTHYSLMVFGYYRIPIVKWMREQAEESLQHACEAGEHITSLEARPSLRISNLLEGPKHSLDDILREALMHEKRQRDNYRTLLGMVENKNTALEEYARKMVAAEEHHLHEVEKMLRKPEEISLQFSA